METLAVTGTRSKGIEEGFIKDPGGAHCSGEYADFSGETSVGITVHFLTLNAEIPAEAAVHYYSGVWLQNFTL